jgi:hypothetical protein
MDRRLGPINPWEVAPRLPSGDGTLRSPVVTLAEGRVLVGGGAVSWAVPLKHSL